MRAYLDHAATTPLLPEAKRAMVDALNLANPSSVHASGRQALMMLNEARETVAAQVNAPPSRVIFTSGGTEADALAVVGIHRARQMADPRRTRLLVLPIEHSAVVESARACSGTVEYFRVDSTGRIDLDHARDLIASSPQTVSVMTCMWANNEVGTIQPIDELVKLSQRYEIPLVCDAVSALFELPQGARHISMVSTPVSALALSSHKIGGPQGVGALILGEGVTVDPIIHGGDQESSRRAGTQNVPGIVGFAAAISTLNTTDVLNATEELRNRIVREVPALVDGAELIGAPCGENRITHNAMISFPGCDAEALVFLFDILGIDVSAGSACHAGVQRPSHVLSAMGFDGDMGRVRFSVGWTTTDSDIDRVIEAVPEVVKRAREAAAVSS